MTEFSDTLDRRWENQLFGVRRSIRYHQRRRAFFDRLDRLGNMLSVILGSTAIFGILRDDHQTVALAASALVTVISSINLVFASSQRARDHSDFARRFNELERRMLGSRSEEALQAVTSARLEIEADEPPVLQVLDCMCHNELMRADGYRKEDMAKIHWWQKPFAQFVDIGADLIHAG